MVEAKKQKKKTKKTPKKGEEKRWNLEFVVNSDRMHDLIMSKDGRGGCVGCCLDA